MEILKYLKTKLISSLEYIHLVTVMEKYILKHLKAENAS